MRTDKLIGLKLWFELRRLYDNCRGQDLIEYALMAGFVATSVVTMFNGVADSFVTIMSRVNSALVIASSS